MIIYSLIAVNACRSKGCDTDMGVDNKRKYQVKRGNFSKKELKRMHR